MTSTQGGRKRPYDEYNIFFILERERLLQENNHAYSKQISFPVDQLCPLASSSDCGFELPPLPPRYRHLILPKDWYRSDKNAKAWNSRVRANSMKKISFIDVTRTAASTWATLGLEELRQICVQNSFRGSPQ